MRLSEILEGIKRVLELAERPDRDEYMLILKVTLTGFLLVGAIAFGVSSAIYLVSGQAPTSP